MKRSWVGILIIPNEIYKSIPEKLSSIIRKAGFDILLKKSIDKDQLKKLFTGECFNGACEIDTIYSLFVVADLSPWSTERNAEGLQERKNTRILKRGPIIRKEINDRLQVAYREEHTIFWTTRTSDAFKILEKLHKYLPGHILDEISALEMQMQIPEHLELIERHTGFNTNGEVCKVIHEGKPAILRLFRPGREQFAENEIKILELSSKIEGIPKILETDSNWVLTTYFENSSPLSDKVNTLGWLPLKAVRKAFEICREIYHEGYALLDFIPANVLINKQGAIQLIDFEWACEVDVPASFEQGLVIKGVGSKDLTTPNGPAKSYRADWESFTGVSYYELMNYPIPLLESRNYIIGLKKEAHRKGSILKKKIFS